MRLEDDDDDFNRVSSLVCEAVDGDAALFDPMLLCLSRSASTDDHLFLDVDIHLSVDKDQVSEDKTKKLNGYETDFVPSDFLELNAILDSSMDNDMFDSDGTQPSSPQDASQPDSPNGTLYTSSSSDESDNSSDMQQSQSTLITETKRRSRRVATSGLSAQEKRELRKVRNRELAAESRKRKNDEMDRLRAENVDLREKILALEARLQQQQHHHHQPIVHHKRSRLGTTISASAAVAAMTALIVTGPMENTGNSATASVLITTLDSCDGRLPLSVVFACSVLFCAIASVVIQSAAASLPLRSLFSRSTRLTITNTV